MLNKKLTVYKILLLVLMSFIIFALTMTLPVMTAINSVFYADTDALVDSIDPLSAKPALKIRMYDSDSGRYINISDTDNIGDIIYKITTVPGITQESLRNIYNESGFKWFLKNKLKLLQNIVTEDSGDAERTVVLITADEVEALLRENAEVIKKHTGYTLTENDYRSVKRFFDDNSKISNYLTSTTIKSSVHIFGDLRTSITLSAVIVILLIVVFFIIGLMISKNLCSSFITMGSALFFAGFASTITYAICKTADIISRADPSNFLNFIAQTISTPFFVCAMILFAFSVLCFVMAVICAKVIYIEQKKSEDEEDDSFSFEYFTNDNAKIKEQKNDIDSTPHTKPESDGAITDISSPKEQEEAEKNHNEWKEFWLDSSDNK